MTDKPSARRFYDIMAGLRIRYASLNNPSLNKVPMLNSSVVDDSVGQLWLGEVLTRLRESRVNAKKIPMLFTMADENERVERLERERRGTRGTS